MCYLTYKSNSMYKNEKTFYFFNKMIIIRILYCGKEFN